jgi:hypothetical protein
VKKLKRFFFTTSGFNALFYRGTPKAKHEKIAFPQKKKSVWLFWPKQNKTCSWRKTLFSPTD